MTMKVGRYACGLCLAVVIIASALPALAGAGCGEVTEDCCPSTPGPECEFGGVCVGGTCRACGGEDELCCPISSCDEGLTCIEDFVETVEGQGGGAAVAPLICVPCGGANEPCCGSECDPGFTCMPCLDNEVGEGGGAGEAVCPPNAAGVCEACGGIGEQCCDQNTCDSGLGCMDVNEKTADQGSGGWLLGETCLPCGGLGETCCDGEMCSGPGLLCAGAVCEACGDVDQQCCASETCPISGGFCVAGTCTAAQRAPAMSAAGLSALILTLGFVAFLGMRRVQV